MDLGICIVNWNTRELLRRCLACLPAATEGLQVDTVVVDNASGDGSAQMVRDEFAGVRLIANAQNRYYAAGNNQGLEALQTPCKLLLNSDIEAPAGALRTLVEWLEAHPRAGAVAPRLVYPDGRLQHSCRSFPDPDTVWWEALGLSRAFPRSRRFGKYKMTWWDYAQERPVDQPMASALLLRSSALEQVGLFDEGFPMFFNDVDLCRRLWDAGWEVWYTPAATVAHHHGASTRLARRAMVAESGRSFLRYYEKQYRGRVNGVCYGMTVALLRAAYAVKGRLAKDG
jgi:GT2 family glycosyltransferase